MHKPLAAIVCNSTWNAFNFRSNLIKKLLNENFRVVLICPSDEYLERVKGLGCEHIELNMSATSKNIISNFNLLISYYTVLRKLHPDIILTFSIKPNLYVSIISLFKGYPIICNVAGLGQSLIKRNWLYYLIIFTYKFSVKFADHIMFQNHHDLAFFVDRNLTRRNCYSVLPGSGVDLERFSPNLKHNRATKNKTLKFIMVSRLLKAKGVIEYLKAAKIVKNRFPEVKFDLAGFCDSNGRNYVSSKEIQEWEEEGVINFLFKVDKVEQLLRDYDCVVLPSYYSEGTPRILLEASSMNKVCISTDNVGCRDAIDDEETGFLCKIKDEIDLAAKMEKVVKMTDSKRREMGSAARKKMVKEFDEKYILKTYLRICHQLLASAKSLVLQT